MKRAISLILALVMCLSLCACSKTNLSSDPTSDDSHSITEPLIIVPEPVVQPTEEELSLREAIYSFYGLDLDTVEYFYSHKDDFTALNGYEIEQLVKGRSFEVVFRDKGWWKGTFLFESSGRIKETIPTIGIGYHSDRRWEVEGDILVLSSNYKSSYEVKEWQVLDVGDGVYLLVIDHETIGLMK